MSEPQAPPPTPEEQWAVNLEKIREILRYCRAETEEGIVFDFEQFAKLLTKRAIPFKVLNRDLAVGELHFIRDEQHVQKTRAENAERDDVKVEATARLGSLEAREKLILDQLYPIP